MTIDVLRMETPLGPVVLAASGAGLHAVEFSESDRPGDWHFARAYAGRALGRGDRARPVAARLAAYFDGDLGALDGLRVAAAGTEFQRRVWDALRRIPAGTTTTYGALAASLASQGAARAVGRANALNPVAIFVPCHRVIGASGELTGYAGGLERKRWLLRHEGALLVA